MTWSDEYINYWGSVFQACRLHTVGLELDRFLEAPEMHLDRLGLADALAVMAQGYLPLRPDQARVRLAWAPGPEVPPAMCREVARSVPAFLRVEQV
ncbi:MAG: hypothetical protein ACOC00_02810 [Halothiobacillaceae bacterium]